MLCGISASNGQKVLAGAVDKDQGPFYCAGCKQELILRKGRIKVHHFSHKPPHTCPRGKGESAEHMRCKETVYRMLKKCRNVTDVDIEADFKDVIADVYCVINGQRVAIEIQRSNLSIKEIYRRTEIYGRLGVNVLWLALYNKKLDTNKYTPKAWEKWCHALYYGRVYYWQSDLNILPVHFSEYSQYVEPSSWYDQSGQEQSSGGYRKIYKNFRTPRAGSILNLATDFKGQFKKSWGKGTVATPNCLAYVDKLQRWWK